MVRLLQINLQHSKNAMTNIFSELSKDDNTIALVQEPWFYKNIIKAPKGYSVFSIHMSRACIIAPSSTPLSICHEFTAPDCTVCCLDVEEGKEQIYLASIYLDITKDCILPAMASFCDFLKRNNAKGILGVDSNAHSTLWSMDQNSRGDQMDQFIIENGLDILNIGKKPTFITSRASSTIDISLAYNAKDYISHWCVLERYFMSDHRCIQFMLHSGKFSLPTVPKTDFQRFRSSLNIEDKRYKMWTRSIIDSEAESLQGAISSALAASTEYIPLSNNPISWWCDDLEKAKRKILNLDRKMKLRPSSAVKNEFDFEKKSFFKACRKAKRESWKKFTCEVDSSKKMALLNRILKSNQHNKIGLLKNREGSWSKNVEESLDILLDIHFPESVPFKADDDTSSVSHRNFPINDNISVTQQKNISARVKASFCSEADLKTSFVNEKTVTLSVNSFNESKSAGSDGFKPRVLQEFIKNKNGLMRLSRLLAAVLEIGYTPRKWCESKVIFIPKPGKTDYGDPKSYRPISLTSYFFKTLEKIVLWSIQNSALKEHPLSSNQHAFRKNYSCDTALSNLVDQIESGINRNKYVLSVNLDIQSAFDWVGYDAAITSMRERNISENIVRWYEQYLYNRTAFATQYGHTSSIKSRRGTPQGGILSPLIWCLTFESLIKIFDSGPITATAFADDLSLNLIGIDPGVMSNIMTNNLKQVASWGKERKLRFVPQKCTAIFFHKKKKFTEPEKVRMNGAEIPYQKHVKFLGVFLDSKLSFKYHLKQKIAKAKQNIMMVRNGTGVLWGPTCASLKWAYNGIVIPTVTFGSIIWSRAAADGQIIQKLSRLNRLISACMFPMRRGTPTAALEIILNLPPVDLVIKERALNSMLRIAHHNRSRWDGCGKGRGHIRYLKNTLLDLGVDKLVFDNTKSLSFQKEYTVDFSSFRKGLPDTKSELQLFSDGSKLDDRVGYGFGIFQGQSELASESGYLGTIQTVFQAEVTAILKGCEMLKDLRARSITFFSDSQAAISALAGFHVNSKLVETCIEKLNQLGSACNVTIKYVKAHCGIEQNETADKLAKQGTKKTQQNFTVLPPLSWAKFLVKKAINSEWCDRWYQLNQARQSKIWFPSLNKRASKFLLGQTRENLGLMVQMITGHNFLNRHESLVNPGTDPTCRLCREEDECAWHLIGECPMLRAKRWEYLGQHFLDSPPDWSPSRLLQFLLKAKFPEMNQREDSNLSQTA